MKIEPLACLSGHTDVITGFQLIPDLGYLVSSSLDAYVPGCVVRSSLHLPAVMHLALVFSYPARARELTACGTVPEPMTAPSESGTCQHTVFLRLGSSMCLVSDVYPTARRRRC